MECISPLEDLMWNGKLEPDSPFSESFTLSNSEDDWVLENNFAKDILLNKNIEESLNDLFSTEDQFMKFEAEEQWIDAKFGSPLYMDFSSPIPSPQPTPLTKVQNAYDILMEPEKFYSNELTQLSQLQTPQQESLLSRQMFDMMSNQESISAYNNNQQIFSSHNKSMMSPCSTSSDYSSDSTNRSTTSDIAVQIVDEILRTRAKDLPDWVNENCDDSLYSTSSSSSVSNTDDCASPTNSIDDRIGDGEKEQQFSTASSKRRTRPYGRGTEDKKSRKKEQNKNAATRYRQKKKEEMKEVLDEERVLLQLNEDLLKKVNEFKREAKYLKKLIKEFHNNGKK